MQAPNLFDKNIFYILSTAQKLLYLYVILGLLLAFLLFLVIRKLILPVVDQNIPSHDLFRPLKFLYLGIFCVGLIMVGFYFEQDLQFANTAHETAIFNSGLYEQRDEGDFIYFKVEQLGRYDKYDQTYEENETDPTLVNFKNEKLALLSGYLKESRALETEEILNPPPKSIDQ